MNVGKRDRRRRRKKIKAARQKPLDAIRKRLRELSEEEYPKQLHDLSDRLNEMHKNTVGYL